MLTDGFYAEVKRGEQEGFTAGQAARALVRAEAGWGRATYALAFTRLVKSYEARAADADVSDDDRTYAKERAEQATRAEPAHTAATEEQINSRLFAEMLENPEQLRTGHSSDDSGYGRIDSLVRQSRTA